MTVCRAILSLNAHHQFGTEWYKWSGPRLWRQRKTKWSQNTNRRKANEVPRVPGTRTHQNSVRKGKDRFNMDRNIQTLLKFPDRVVCIQIHIGTHTKTIPTSPLKVAYGLHYRWKWHVVYDLDCINMINLITPPGKCRNARQTARVLR